MTAGYFAARVFCTVLGTLVAGALLAFAAYKGANAMFRRAGRWAKSAEWKGKRGKIPIPRRPAWPPPPPLLKQGPSTVGTGTVSWTFVIPSGRTTDLSSFVDPPSTYGGHDVSAP